jgi:hypothetical protein
MLYRLRRIGVKNDELFDEYDASQSPGPLSSRTVDCKIFSE